MGGAGRLTFYVDKAGPNRLFKGYRKVQNWLYLQKVVDQTLCQQTVLRHIMSPVIQDSSTFSLAFRVTRL